MIHSAWPTVSPVANIVFTLFCFAGSVVRTDIWTCAKTMIPTDRDRELAEWISFIISMSSLRWEVNKKGQLFWGNLFWNFAKFLRKRSHANHGKKHRTNNNGDWKEEVELIQGVQYKMTFLFHGVTVWLDTISLICGFSVKIIINLLSFYILSLNNRKVI